ncbi:MAG: NAD(P)H-binding protein [Oscillospiraceae bacterium]|nr:NAD(P)H-binding protein [Oscillospiraceae bacterium]
MKITVIGAAGRLGSLLVKEGLARGHEVAVVVRDAYMVPSQDIRVIECDIHELLADDVREQDAVVNAFGVWEKDKVGQHISSLSHLADILAGKETRLLIAGTAGNLYVDERQTVRIIDLPDFPEGAYPVVKAMCDAYDILKVRSDVRWTYLSPAPDFAPKGRRTGVYRISGERLPRNMRGKSEVSYADFAAAIFDVAEDGAYIREHISVYSV